ncbi:hypothetical protein DFH11DRAFT_1595209 [Phellopilus nigrolimitatus]|nr:hypothetical protein DFH11DRAFT_1595209 [Phellopilus nigrolimitatus]
MPRKHPHTSRDRQLPQTPLRPTWTVLSVSPNTPTTPRTPPSSAVHKPLTSTRTPLFLPSESRKRSAVAALVADEEVDELDASPSIARIKRRRLSSGARAITVGTPADNIIVNKKFDDSFLTLISQLNLTEEQRRQLKDVSHLPTEKHALFLCGLIMANQPPAWEIPTEVKVLHDTVLVVTLFDAHSISQKKFNKIATSLLLAAKPERFHLKAEDNVMDFYLYLRTHAKEIGLESNWAKSFQKLAALESACLLSFSEARRRVKKRVKKATYSKKTLGCMAASLDIEKPTEPQLGVLSLLRAQSVTDSPNNYWVKVDEKLVDIYKLPSSSAERRFRKLKQTDARLYPEQATN